MDTANLADLQRALASGAVRAVEVLEECVARISAADARLHSVLAVHPEARAAAAASDQRRAAGRSGPLDGVPVLIKDNIAVAGMPTTAGSRALARHRPADAALVTRLRDAGAIVLGKTNLSEWANFRSTKSTSGWSAVGGQTRNPHDVSYNPSGSSSGSAAAAAAGFAPLTVGTETDGSIVSPAGHCGVVGFKPTLGTIPGTGIVPISSAQDTAGPITRDVAAAAALYAALADRQLARLDAGALAGVRVGVWSPAAGRLGADTLAVLSAARAALVAAGADLNDVAVDDSAISDGEWPALLAEFRPEIDAYLGAAEGSAVHDLTELIAFNAADDVELSVFGQENFELAVAAPALDDPGYLEHRRTADRLARAALDGPFAEVDVLLSLTNAPAGLIDHAHGDGDPFGTSTPAAVAGYPSITVPAGFVGTLPIGVSLTATAGRDDWLLNIAYAFEQATRARRDPNEQGA